MNCSSLWGRMVPLTLKRCAGTAKILDMTWKIANAYSIRRSHGMSEIGGEVKLGAPASGDHRVGAKK